MKAFLGIAAGALLMASAPPVEARTFKDIMDPYSAKYGDWKKIRKAMLQRQKAGETFSADDWFVLGAMCAIEPPKGPSKILNMLEGSPCKNKVIDYFERAGAMGNPRGFNQASYYARTRGKNPARAWYFAQLAYRLSGDDADLAADALERIEEVRLAASERERVLVQVDTEAGRLAASNAYGSNAARPAAAAMPPSMGWLDFENPRRCTWSDAAMRIFDNATGFDESKMYGTIPASVRIPGVAKPVTSRITRPDRSVPSMVVYYLDFKGRWNGLTVLGLTNTFLEESHGVHGMGIRFAEPVSVVADRLLKAGFVVNPKGGPRDQIDKRDRDGNIDGVMTFLKRQNGETVFLCDEVYYASYGA